VITPPLRNRSGDCAPEAGAVEQEQQEQEEEQEMM
jgi:hypothetical protein